jgi:hypothetical protein
MQAQRVHRISIQQKEKLIYEFLWCRLEYTVETINEKVSRKWSQKGHSNLEEGKKPIIEPTKRVIRVLIYVSLPDMNF